MLCRDRLFEAQYPLGCDRAQPLWVPDFGRIGPIAVNRPGEHRAQSFMMMQGAGPGAGAVVAEGSPVDRVSALRIIMGIPSRLLRQPALAAPPAHAGPGAGLMDQNGSIGCK